MREVINWDTNKQFVSSVKLQKCINLYQFPSLRCFPQQLDGSGFSPEILLIHHANLQQDG